MSIKTILVPLIGGDRDESALVTAGRVANAFDGHVEALFVDDYEELVRKSRHGGETLVLDQQLEVLRSAVERREQAAQQCFAEVTERMNISVSAYESPVGTPGASASWRHMYGSIEQITGMRGGVFDLIVIGGSAGDTDMPSGRIVEAALFGSGRPVILSPPTPPESMAKHILIGWNRTIQANHAVTAAMPFLERAAGATIFSIATGAKQGPAPDELAAGLKWHGVTAEIREIEPDYRSVGEALLAEAEAAAADLLVMGAYSHSRLRELVLGGVTRYVLENAAIPVLMAH